MDLLLVLVGIALLYLGGELLVRSSTRLARTLGMSPLLVGLTVVAFGTSAPELAASLSAALRGSGEIAVGNVIGSNIANIGLILGACALVTPIRAAARTVRREALLLPATALLLLALLWDGALGRPEGALLLGGLALYLLLTLRGARETAPVEAEFEAEFGTGSGAGRDEADRAPLPPLLLGIAGGLALLVLGAQALVAGATGLAQAAGLSERVIGLTVVAVGTSLPELAASLVAALRREADIALGNVIGSNAFNVLGILGATAVVSPLALAGGAVAATRIDLLVALAASALLLPLLATGARLARWEGGALLAGWGVYVLYLLR